MKRKKPDGYNFDNQQTSITLQTPEGLNILLNNPNIKKMMGHLEEVLTKYDTKENTELDNEGFEKLVNSFKEDLKIAPTSPDVSNPDMKTPTQQNPSYPPQN